LHPDGEIPLFGDSCWGEAHSVGEIDALARLLELKPGEISNNSADDALLGVSSGTLRTEHRARGNGQGVAGKQRHGGMSPTDRSAGRGCSASVVGPYWIWRNEGDAGDAGDALIFDAGQVGADDLPAHAHCDLLGFEASVAGQRWFVDSGLFDYGDGEMRDYCRSSVAHNGVTIDDQNCCDVWSRFRMGRRGRPTQFAHGQQGRFCWCRASHDGYRQLGAAELSRLMVAHSSGAWFCLEHATRSCNQALTGRLHLAQGIKVRRPNTSDQEAAWQLGNPQRPAAQPLAAQQLILRGHNIERRLTATAGARLGFAQGWYCDGFGRRTETQVITYRPDSLGDSEGTFGWSLSPIADSPIAGSPIADSPIASPTNAGNFATIGKTGQVELAIEGDPDRFHYNFPQ